MTRRRMETEDSPPNKNTTESQNLGLCEWLIDCLRTSPPRPKMRYQARASSSPNNQLKRSSVSSIELLLVLLLVAQISFITAVHDDNENEPSSAPRITIQPNDLVAIEGESAELNCDAEGQPEPTIEWFHNGQPIRGSTNSRTTMGGSIQFLDIRPNTTASSSPSSGQQSDAGIYHCVARNRLGEARSRNATLQVAYIKEQFRLAPRDKLAAIGDTVTFDCWPRAWPEPAIQWRRNGQPLEASRRIAIQRIGKTELALNNAAAGSSGPISNNQVPSNSDSELVDVFGSQLVIKLVEKADEAKYSCLVESKGTHRLIERESPAGQLIASVKPYFIEPPQHKSGQVGDKVAMQCRMGGDPEPVVSWRRQNGQPLSEKTTIDPHDKTLIIESLRPSDQGVYICEGENNVGSARALAQVQVIARPKFTVQPIDQTVDHGSRVQLKCSGEATPPPMMFWYKEGHRQLMFPAPATPSTSSTPGTDSPSFRSLQGGWPQAAALTATMTNSDNSPASNRLFSMPVDHLATTTVSQTNYFGSRIYVDSQGTLNIVNATSRDSGYYACALISQVGSVMAKAKVTVRQTHDQLGNVSPAVSDPFYSDPLQQARMGSGSFVSSGKYDLLPPPVIKMGSVNQTLPTNTSTKLLCDVVSQVAYKIQWFFDGQPLQEDPPRIIVLEDGNLQIQDLQTSDSGLYTCVVTAANDQTMPVASPFEPLEASMLTSAPPIAQSTAHSSFLKVADVRNPSIAFQKMMIETFPTSPGPPFMVGNNGNDAITIAWTSPADSGTLPVKQYVVEHYDTSQEQLGWRVIHRPNGKESLLIDGLSAEGSHFFVVRATNGLGTGPSSAIAGPFRTLLGENHYQLEQQRRRNPTGLDFADTRADANQARERLMSVATNIVGVTSISSTSIRIQWSISNLGNASFAQLNSIHSEFIEGYSIRYRATGLADSLIGRDTDPFGLGMNQYDSRAPSSLPLLTSYVDEQELIIPSRPKRDLAHYYDYVRPFNEVRVTGHDTEQYTINGLRPFTAYQFFVVPYYKDIDGLPSNMLTGRTNEDHPSVAPLVPSIRPINNTAIRLLWPHIPAEHANGIIRDYAIRMNNSDILNSPMANLQVMPMNPRILRLPVASLTIAPLNNPSTTESRNPSYSIREQHYVVMYDITNLTHKSFYSIQVAGSTSAGLGPWSEPRNFVMDPKMIAEQLRSSNNELDDIMSQSFLSNTPYLLDESAHSRELASYYMIVPIILMIVCVIFTVGLIYYRRNSQQVATWKKTISEHFTNKFYMPSAADHHHRGPGSIQQNIYDHQHHLIYSAGSTHMQHPPPTNQTMWTGGLNNGGPCMTSSGTGSLSSHGGLLPINNDPNSRSRAINDQVLMVNGTTLNKDRLIRANLPNSNNMFCHGNTNLTARTMNPVVQQQIIHHGGDYYSVINNVAEYEELADQQQRHNMQMASGNVLERHQTGSSNSDTSCPSSVTRLLPNQNYNRDLLARNQIDQRHEMILQQQINCEGDIKQPFITVINGSDPTKYMTQKAALSPYATTNLMGQMSRQQQQQTGQMFSNNQMNISRQQQSFTMHNGGSSIDDSSKILMAQQMSGNSVGPMNSFRTLQRNHNNLQPSIAHSQPTHVQQILVQQNEQPQYNGGRGNYGVVHQLPNHGQGNIIGNGPLIDNKSNLYEHIDYNGTSHSQMNNIMQMANIHGQQGDLISSSTSSGSVKSPPDNGQAKFRRVPQIQTGQSEAHDLRVFSAVHGPSDPAERQRLTDGADGDPPGRLNDEREDEDASHVDETTAFRRPSISGEEQRTRQMSKRKRKQQRSRQHNNNQNVG